MDNRCRASLLHVRSMRTLEELNDVFDYEHPAPLSDGQAEKIAEILSRSRADAEAYLRLYGELLPDRGGEGQLVSYHETTLVYIDAVSAGFFVQGSAMALFSPSAYASLTKAAPCATTGSTPSVRTKSSPWTGSAIMLSAESPITKSSAPNTPKPCTFSVCTEKNCSRRQKEDSCEAAAHLR